MVNKDKRLKIMSEIISGMRIIKFFAWEDSYINAANTVRKVEVDTLKSSSYLRATTLFSWAVSPVFVALFTFLSFTLFGSRADSYYCIYFGGSLQCAALSAQHVAQRAVQLGGMQTFPSDVLASISTPRTGTILLWNGTPFLTLRCPLRCAWRRLRLAGRLVNLCCMI